MAHHNTAWYRFGSWVVRLTGPAFPEELHLHRFRTDPQEPELDIQVTVTEPLPKGETIRQIRAQYAGFTELMPMMAMEEQPGQLRLWVSERYREAYGTGMLLQALNFPARLTRRGDLLLHAACIETAFGAVVFAAESGVGKSTQAALWQQHRGAGIINGDRSLLTRMEGTWTACGIPYCGTSGICTNRQAPLKAVVLLEQAPEDSIRPAAPREAVAAFLRGCSYEKQDRRQVAALLDSIEALLKAVPVYRFFCTKSENAVMTLEEQLCKTKPQPKQNPAFPDSSTVEESHWVSPSAGPLS